MARKRPQAAEEEPTPAEDASPASSHEEEQEEEEEQFSGSLELDSGGSDDGEDGSSGSEEEEDDDESEEQSEEEVGAGSEEEDADDEDEDDGSGSDDDDSNSDDEQDHEQQVRDAIRDYAHTVAQEARAARDATAADADANPAAPPHDDPDDPATDSSEEERPHRNTVGDVPLKWYRAEEHIGYDADGKKIAKKGGADGRGGRDALDALVARADDPAGALLRNLYDEYNDEVVRLTDEEVRMVMRVRKGLFPHVEVDPHAPYVDWFSGDVSAVPLRGNTLAEPKRRFLPSKHEEAKVVKLVRALRAGWLKTRKEQRKAARRARQGMGGAGAGPSGLYLLWGEDDAGGGAGGDGDIRRTGASLTYLAPQKPRLPGHAESYRPPPEYVPTEEEVRAKSLASAEANGWPDDTGAADGVRCDADGTPVVLDEDGKREFVPRTHDSLRRVPAYARFVHERFERCLDLYLCPRVRRKRMHIDPETLVPQLPKPADLKPFPHQLAHRFVGHVGRVRCLAPHPAGGQWLATGGEDGCVRLWEVRTGRCVRRWRLGGGAKGGGAAAGAVVCVAWCPHPRPVCVLAAAVGRSVYLLPTGLGGEAGDLAAAAKLGAIEASAVVAGEGGEADEDGDEDDEQERLAAAAAARAAADAGSPGEPGPVKGEAQLREGDGQAGGLGEEGDLAAGGAPPKTEELCSWRSAPQPIGKGALELRHRFPVSHLAWHRGGDYFVTVAPTGNTQAVLVHQLSRQATQNPFRKSKGRVTRALFHPTKPFLFVASQGGVRCYNLAKQALARRLGAPSAAAITCMAVHPSGDHVLTGGADRRVAWYDLDLGSTPYRALRYHAAGVRAVAFHPAGYPLFASAADDGHAHVFHGQVYQDLMTNPTIVPVKVLRGHGVVDQGGVLDVAWHPTQPWLFTAGADGTAVLWCH